MKPTHENVASAAEFSAGQLVIVSRPKMDGTNVRRPVMLLLPRRDQWVAAKIIGQDHLPRHADVQDAIAIDGCGLRRASLVLPGWYFTIRPAHDWQPIGVCPTPLFNEILAKHQVIAAQDRFISAGQRAYARRS